MVQSARGAIMDERKIERKTNKVTQATLMDLDELARMFRAQTKTKEGDRSMRPESVTSRRY